MPALVAAVIFTVPLKVTSGLITVICVSLSTLKLGASTDPKEILVTPLNLWPKIMIGVCPSGGPLDGKMLEEFQRRGITV